MALFSPARCGPRTRLLAVSQLSNVLGCWQPLDQLLHPPSAGRATVVDGAQGVVHGRHDMTTLGCDSMCCPATSSMARMARAAARRIPAARASLAVRRRDGADRRLPECRVSRCASFEAGTADFRRDRDWAPHWTISPPSTPPRSADMNRRCTTCCRRPRRAQRHLARSARPGRAGQLCCRRCAPFRSRSPAHRTGHRRAQRQPLRHAAHEASRPGWRHARLARPVQRPQRSAALLRCAGPGPGAAAMMNCPTPPASLGDLRPGAWLGAAHAC